MFKKPETRIKAYLIPGISMEKCQMNEKFLTCETGSCNAFNYSTQMKMFIKRSQ